MADMKSKLAEALINYVEMPGRQLNAFFGAKPKTNPLAAARALKQVGGDILGGVKSAYTAPGRALSGELDPNSSEGMQEAMNFAMNVGAGGLGATAIKPVQGNNGTLGMFVGRKSQTWNPEKEKMFLDLDRQGVNPESAWAQTETIRGPEGLLKQEISDRGSFLKGIGNFEDIVMKRYNALNTPENPITRMSVSDVMHHPELFNAYPHLGNLEIRFMPKGINKKARIDLNNNVIEIHPQLDAKEAQSSMLHELQHAVQEHEGFARGGSTEEFYKQLASKKEAIYNRIQSLNKEMGNLAQNPNMTREQRDAYDLLMQTRQELVPEAQKYDAIDMMENASNQYKRLGGEAESRLTQARRNLTPEQRLKNYPYNQNEFGLDVPYNELTVKR